MLDCLIAAIESGLDHTWSEAEEPHRHLRRLFAWFWRRGSHDGGLGVSGLLAAISIGMYSNCKDAGVPETTCHRC